MGFEDDRRHASALVALKNANPDERPVYLGRYLGELMPAEGE